MKIIRPIQRLFLKTLASVAIVSFVAPAHAVFVGLDVFVDGEQAGSFNETMLGCTDVAGTPTANCDSGGANATAGDLRLDSWNLFLDEDPVISGTVAVTNIGATDQHFTMIFTLPITPAIPGGTLIGGSIQGGGTDLTGDGVTISTASGSSIFSALIDGNTVQTLYDDALSFSNSSAFGSVNIASLDFGSPIPSQAGPAALTNIGIEIDFILSAGDSATFTSVFVVLPTPVPVPAAMWLFGSALIGLAGIKRKK